MRLMLPVALALTSASLATGCFHYTAAVPGVLDLRSDGSSAAPNEAPVVGAAPTTNEADGDVQESAAPITRTGVASFIEGDGVIEQGTQFTIEDRHWFLGVTPLLPGLFLVANDSSSEELEAAVGGEAVRNLRLGHRVTFIDVLFPIGLNLIPVVGGCATAAVAPRPWTFTASGERIEAGRGAAVAPPMPPVVPTDEPGAPLVDPAAANDGGVADPQGDTAAGEPQADAPTVEAPTEAPPEGDEK